MPLNTGTLDRPRASFMSEIHTERHWLDYFAGAVPASLIFDGQLEDLRAIVAPLKRDREIPEPAVEICLIGLIAYFEAFCKSQFAATINIFPQLLESFASRRKDVMVNSADLLHLDGPILERIGFLIAEKYDFGTPKSINGLFLDLLNKTPFSVDEASRFDALLDDRHLLVHHGGIFNPRYKAERFFRRSIDRSRLFLDSLLVTVNAFLEAASFLEEMSVKIRDLTSKALTTNDLFKAADLPTEAREAAEQLAARLPPREMRGLTGP